MEPHGKGSKLLAVSLVAVTVGLSGYVVLSEPDYIYAVNIEQAFAQPGRWWGRELRLGGELVPGTLKKRARGCGFDFALRGPSGREPYLLVHYDGCALPYGVCDLAPSVPPGANDSTGRIQLSGQLEPRGPNELHFQASALIATCPGKYWATSEGGDGFSALCARHRPGFYCPMCEGARSGLPAVAH